MSDKRAMTDTDFGLEVRALLAPTPGTVDSKLPSAAKTPAPLSPPATVPLGPIKPYSHEAMIELMLEHPEYSHAQFAAAFGRPPQWFASVLASTSFQQALEPRRAEIADPGLAATLEERMRALALQSVEVLQTKLGGASVQDATILKALEIGTKALGMGAPQLQPSPAPQQQIGPDAVAERILSAMAKAKEKARNSEAIEVAAKALG